MTDHTLRPRAKSDDFDILTDAGEVRGQVITSPHGYTVYVLGDLESLFEPFETAEEALNQFDEWAESNPTDLTAQTPDEGAAQP